MSIFRICTHLQILLEWLNQELWDEQNTEKTIWGPRQGWRIILRYSLWKCEVDWIGSGYDLVVCYYDGGDKPLGPA